MATSDAKSSSSKAPHVVDVMRNTAAEAGFIAMLMQGDAMARTEPDRFADRQPSILLALLPGDAMTFGGEPLMSHGGLQEIFLACILLIRSAIPMQWAFVLEMLNSNGATSRQPKAEWRLLFDYIEQEDTGTVTMFADEYARILLEKRQARALKRAYDAAQAALLRGDEGAADNAALAASQILRLAVQAKQNGPMPAGRAFVEAALEIDARCSASRAGETMMGLPTGFAQIDNAIRGLRPGNLAILAARPSVGKTTMAIQIIMRNARNSGALFFSLEMTRQEVLDKMIAIYTRVPFETIRNGTLSDAERDRVWDARDHFDRCGFVIDDQAGQHVAAIAATAIAQKSKDERLGLIVVDYLQLLKAERRGGNRENEVAEISKSLKALAKTLGLPVLALAQLNRAAEQRGQAKKAHDRKPKLSDLRESGQIEQDADVVIFLNRDGGGATECSVAKARNARLVDWFDLRFDMRTVTFFESPSGNGAGI